VGRGPRLRLAKDDAYHEIRMATTRLQAALAALAWLLAAASGSAQTSVVAAAGDIACDPADPNYNGGVGTAAACHMRATSDLLAGTSLDAVLVLGDNQYEDGAFVKYQASFDPSWGRIKPLIRRFRATTNT